MKYIPYNWHDTVHFTIFVCAIFCLQNIQQEIRKIAKFIDVELTDAELEEVVQRTSFKNMKNDSTKHGNVQSSFKMFRKGQ